MTLPACLSFETEEMDVPFVIVIIGVLAFSVILHELGHAWVALKLGDTTAARLGRLTLNPIPHIDPFMTIILPLVLYVGSQGAFTFGGARPVPVNPANFTSVAPRKGMMLVAAAGPLVNLLIALVIAPIVHVLFEMNLMSEFLFNTLVFSMMMNIFLSLLNMVPIPPLDGSKVLAGFLPRDLAYRYLSFERFGFIFLIILVMIDGFKPLVSITKNLMQFLLPV
jgi:Zn-dependent protease